MKIAMLGPVSTKYLSKFIPRDLLNGLPMGMGGYPVNFLIEGLLNLNHEVVVYTFDESICDLVRVKANNLEIIYLPRRKTGREKDFFAKEIKYLSQLLVIDTSDVVHVHWAYEYLASVVKSRKRFVLTMHDNPFKIFYYEKNRYRMITLVMSIYGIIFSRNIVSVSSYIDKILKFRYLRRSMKVIPNAIKIKDLPILTEPRSSSHTLNFLAAPNGFGGWKNTRTLLDSFYDLLHYDARARLDLVGIDCGIGEVAEKYAIQLGIREKIKFHGKLNYDEYMDLLKGFQGTFIHPSLEESFSMTMVEAIMWGLPVIGGISSGAIPEILGYGVYGKLCRIEDRGSLSSAMIEVSANYSKFAEMSLNGSYYYRRALDPNKIAEEYTDIYGMAK